MNHNAKKHGTKKKHNTKKIKKIINSCGNLYLLHDERFFKKIIANDKLSKALYESITFDHIQILSKNKNNQNYFELENKAIDNDWFNISAIGRNTRNIYEDLLLKDIPTAVKIIKKYGLYLDLGDYEIFVENDLFHVLLSSHYDIGNEDMQKIVTVAHERPEYVIDNLKKNTNDDANRMTEQIYNYINIRTNSYDNIYDDLKSDKLVELLLITLCVNLNQRNIDLFYEIDLTDDIYKVLLSDEFYKLCEYFDKSSLLKIIGNARFNSAINESIEDEPFDSVVGFVIQKYCQKIINKPHENYFIMLFSLLKIILESDEKDIAHDNESLLCEVIDKHPEYSMYYSFDILKEFNLLEKLNGEKYEWLIGYVKSSYDFDVINPKLLSHNAISKYWKDKTISDIIRLTSNPKIKNSDNYQSIIKSYLTTCNKSSEFMNNLIFVKNSDLISLFSCAPEIITELIQNEISGSENSKKRIKITVDDHDSNIMELIDVLKDIISHKSTGSPTNLICGICDTDKITHAFQICGHTVCESCSKQLSNCSVCPYCRTSNKTIKLYIG